jgi:hypothetical protein
MKLNLTRLWIVWVVLCLLGGAGTYWLGHAWIEERRTEALLLNPSLEVVYSAPPTRWAGGTYAFLKRWERLGRPGVPDRGLINHLYARWARRFSAQVETVTLVLMVAPLVLWGGWRWAQR